MLRPFFYAAFPAFFFKEDDAMHGNKGKEAWQRVLA